MIKMNFGSSVINLPGMTLDKIKNANDTDLRTIVCIGGGILDEGEIATVLGIPEEEVNKSVAFWRGAGVIEGGDVKKKPVTPSTDASRVYTGEEIKRFCETDESMESLIANCRAILNTEVFALSESSSVIYMRHNLNLEPEYILLLCSHYAKNEHATIRFIEKKAIELYDKGIRTLPALEALVAEEEKKYSTEHVVRKLFGWGDRALSKKENDIITSWTKDYHVSEEMIRKAYEETVNNTDKPNIGYMNKIIENWHNGNIVTPEQVEEQKEKRKAGRTGRQTKNAPSFDLKKFFDDAIARGEGSENK